jgi:hypothetical protein
MQSMRKAGRPERPLDPGTGPEKELACALRELREKNGSPSYRAMATRAHYSASALARAASGASLPSRDLLLAYVRACGGDEEERARRWDVVAAQLNQASGQVDQESTPIHAGDGRPRRSRARILVAAPAAVALAAGITAAAMANGHSTAAPSPSGAPTVYHDGEDPIVTGCSQDVQTVDQVPVYSAPGERFGTLLLRHSPSCAMSWGTVMGPNPHRYRVYIIARRPADGAQAPSSWAENTPDSYGNMLSTSRSCVLAEAYMQTPAGAGPWAQTRCLG